MHFFAIETQKNESVFVAKDRFYVKHSDDEDSDKGTIVLFYNFILKFLDSVLLNFDPPTVLLRYELKLFKEFKTYFVV